MQNAADLLVHVYRQNPPLIDDIAINHSLSMRRLAELRPSDASALLLHAHCLRERDNICYAPALDAHL